MNLLNAKSGALLLGIALGAAGCGSNYTAYCEAKIDCEGGNDADIEACEIDREASEDIASVYGCDADWEDYYLCWDDTGYCDRNNGNDYRYVHNDACRGEEDRWNDCTRYGFR